MRLEAVRLTVPLTALAASAFYRHDRRGHAAGLLLLVYGAAFLGHDVLAANTELLGGAAGGRSPLRTRSVTAWHYGGGPDLRRDGWRCRSPGHPGSPTVRVSPAQAVKTSPRVAKKREGP